MTDSQTLVRPARLDELDRVAEVHGRARSAYYAGLVPAADLARRAAELPAAYRAVVRERGSTLLCAEQGGAIVGIALLTPPHPHHEDLAGPGIGELSQLHVLPEYWRRGIGSALHRACVTAWRESGTSTAILEVWDRNDRARAFYRHHGWGSDSHTRPGRGETGYLRHRLDLTTTPS